MTRSTAPSCAPECPLPFWVFDGSHKQHAFRHDGVDARAPAGTVCWGPRACARPVCKVVVDPTQEEGSGQAWKSVCLRNEAYAPFSVQAFFAQYLLPLRVDAAECFLQEGAALCGGKPHGLGRALYGCCAQS